MDLDKAFKIFNTVKYLKFSQIIYRIYYRFKKPGFFIKSQYSLEFSEWKWSGPWTHLPSIKKENIFQFLSIEGQLHSSDDWNSPKYEKLWLYNLHYFDDLSSKDNSTKIQYYKTLIKRWIEENPVGKGNGWEPYPLSLRIVNWVKWMSAQETVEQQWIQSLNIQTECLLNHIEYHILGNHLFANAKALIFAGAFLKGDVAKKSLNRGLKILDNELSEQFLNDGAHFELSPMYHSILLWDLLELINLCKLSTNSELIKRETTLRKIAEKALNWLKHMVHPDEQIGLFNDAAFAIAPEPKRIFDYSNTLGLKIKDVSNVLVSMIESGYSRITQDKHVMIIDHGKVGPDYLPGHAHADTLSFEWSVEKNRVLVNGGTSVYGTGPERQRQRKTSSHNTVEVNYRDSSEVWGGFRVARRARGILVDHAQNNTEVLLIAEHNGYKRLSNGIIHNRKYISGLNKIEITDNLSENFSSAIAFYHLHPDIKITLVEDKEIILGLTDGKKIKVKAQSPILIEDSSWHPYFGVAEKNKVLKIHFSKNNETTTFEILSETM